MEIKTKFNLGQTVHAIIFSTKEIKVKCVVCNGKGKIDVPNFGKTECPKCFGDGFKTEYGEKKWFVPDESYYHFVVRKIGIEINQNKKERTWTYYMSANSGTMFDEKNLFATIKEAELECDKRNS